MNDISLGRLAGWGVSIALFLLLLRLDAKANLKRRERSCQLLAPLMAFGYCIVLMVFAAKLWNILADLLRNLSEKLVEWSEMLTDGAINIPVLHNIVAWLVTALKTLLERVNILFLALVLLNLLILLAHIIVKKIMVVISARLCRNGLFGAPLRGLFYDHDDDGQEWYLKPHLGQCRTFVKVIFAASVAVALAMMFASEELFRREMLDKPFFPVFMMIILGEIFFFLNGLTWPEKQAEDALSAEGDDAQGRCNYAVVRKALQKLFGDHLVVDDITASSAEEGTDGCSDLISEMESNMGAPEEMYGRYMRILQQKGIPLDKNLLTSGRDLLNGKSILFNDPFYYDMIPYAFFAMNQALLQHRKILIVLGRHNTESEIAAWCEEGLYTVTGVNEMWRIGVLGQKTADLDVGIITRSSVHDLQLHETNEDFFASVAFVVLIEPSKLITTAQVGLRSIAGRVGSDEKQPVTYCSMDKNCDGVVDALSHILMVNISEVSATNHPEGLCTYMCWEAGEENWQHRMLPNLSRYLGVGTELSFAALKNQVRQSFWYGGESFPVIDIRWIARQYYYELLHYAQLPTDQKMLDECFCVSPSMWDARPAENRYIIVEDEAFNMFEVKREFATRAKKQGFINVITSDYLLRDYMASNESLFNADAKAIPYIVADYARTERNAAFRLCLNMSIGFVSQQEIHHELMLVGVEAEDPAQALWKILCQCGQNAGAVVRDGDGTLRITEDGKEYTFTRQVLRSKRKFSLRSGKMETVYWIESEHFKRLMLRDLRNANYIAEDEDGQRHFLGAELRGQIFQKFLPGQFFTFSGKYYEMLGVTAEGQVLVRRAADHINGRPFYRQIRRYTLSNVCSVEKMGSIRDVGGLKISRQLADIRVETPAYWVLERYHDFKSGKRLEINGVPERNYYRKQVLRLELPAEVTDDVAPTVALLFNEVFRTLFAENSDYIVALTPDEIQPFTTYSLEQQGEGQLPRNSLYIVEDSLLDIGLLIAVERNLNRIFSMVCDYLDWHFTALEESLNPPPKPEPPTYVRTPEEQEEEESKREKKGLLGWLKRLWKRIADFFRKLFGKKKKGKSEEPEPVEAGEPADTDETVEAGEPVDTDEAVEAGKPADTDEAVEVGEPADTSKTAETGEAEAAAPEKPLGQYFTLRNPSTGPAVYQEEAASDPEEKQEAEPDDKSPAEGERETEPDDGGTVEFTFEPEGAVRSTAMYTRKPYHERYYLLYGGDELSQELRLSETLEMLRQMGYDHGELEQARKGKSIAKLIEMNYVPNQDGVHYCDFCGMELTGAEYDVLPDGRERCINCGRTSIKTEGEFRKLYREVAEGMELFYGVRINVPVKIKMVNAKRLHKALGKSFIPTASADSRAVGLACSKDNTILLETGAPRLRALMTLVHEMTHIWQFQNWDRAEITRQYGPDMELEVYEGMARWSEIQYAYLIGETATAKREEICTRHQDDEYGHGFLKYVSRYPISEGTQLEGATPFEDKKTPL